jgi:hypothetical protein
MINSASIYIIKERIKICILCHLCINVNDIHPIQNNLENSILKQNFIERNNN